MRLHVIKTFQLQHIFNIKYTIRREYLHATFIHSLIRFNLRQLTRVSHLFRLQLYVTLLFQVVVLSTYTPYRINIRIEIEALILKPQCRFVFQREVLDLQNNTFQNVFTCLLDVFLYVSVRTIRSKPLFTTFATTQLNLSRLDMDWYDLPNFTLIYFTFSMLKLLSNTAFGDMETQMRLHI